MCRLRTNWLDMAPPAESCLDAEDIDGEDNFVSDFSEEDVLEWDEEDSDSEYYPEAKKTLASSGRTVQSDSSEMWGSSSSEDEQITSEREIRGKKRTHCREGGRGRGKARRIDQPKEISSCKGLWLDSTHSDTVTNQPIFRPLRPPGPQLLESATYTALNLFQLFITNSMLQSIIVNSNKYGRLEGKPWQDITLQDMYSYLCLVIYMGIVDLPCYNDYWRGSELYKLPFPSQVMSSRQFFKVCSHIHLSDPDGDKENEAKKGTPAFDRLFKVKPLYTDMRHTCQSNYHPRQKIAVDERLIKSRTRISSKQNMMSKAVKCGYKLYVVADSSNGYTWDFFIFEGKMQVKQGKGLSYDSVMELVKPQLLGTGYKLYVDNFFTSPPLFRDLLQKKIWACGTMQPNRLDYSKDNESGLDKKSPKGSLRWKREGELLFVQWKDSRVVTMCSTFHQAHGDDIVTRKVKLPDGQWAQTKIIVPPVIKDYNQSMGAVDYSDALIGYHTVLHKTRKWYRTFFFHFLDIGIVNAYILHKELVRSKGEKLLTQKQFRELLILDLYKVGAPSNVRQERAADPQSLHLVKCHTEEKRRRCRVCHLKTRMVCRQCDAALCATPNRDCFGDYHHQL